MNSKKILFFDFDGTLCMQRYWRSLPQKEHTQVQNLLFGDDRTKINNWMRGSYSAEEVNQYISDHINIDYEYLWDIFIEDCQTMQVMPDLLHTIDSFRKRYIVILITGNMDSFTRFTVPSLKLEQHFDVISNSYYEGRHKTDDNGALFVKYTTQFSVDMADCLLFDDSDKVLDIFSLLGGDARKVVDDQDTLRQLITLNEYPM